MTKNVFANSSFSVLAFFNLFNTNFICLTSVINITLSTFTTCSINLS